MLFQIENFFLLGYFNAKKSKSYYIITRQKRRYINGFWTEFLFLKLIIYLVCNWNILSRNSKHILFCAQRAILDYKVQKNIDPALMFEIENNLLCTFFSCQTLYHWQQERVHWWWQFLSNHASSDGKTNNPWS